MWITDAQKHGKSQRNFFSFLWKFHLKLPTIREVAKFAGVAPITVSRDVNDKGYVSQETRERVEYVV